MPNTQKAIDQICTYRGLPNLKKGMACEVDGESGVIFGGNHAANLNVKFNDGRVRNCHPGWRMKVFNGNGDIYYKSDDV
jgi:hypothetical protein